MSKVKIGIQLMIFREAIKKEGPYEVLKKISEIGFKCIELSQVDMTPENVSEVKKACEDFGIEIGAMSAAVEPMPPYTTESLETTYDKIVNDAKTLNCNYLRIGMLPFHYLGSMEKALAFAKKADELAEKLEKDGIQLYYHNHHSEFTKYEGEHLLDIMRDNTTRLGFELDVHWVQFGGKNPVDVIKEYKGRLKLLHLKDYRIVAPDFSKADFTDMRALMQTFTYTVQFGELGEGNLNFPEIIEAGITSGTEYMFIEQDDTYGRNPYESITISKNYLESIGYEV